MVFAREDEVDYDRKSEVQAFDETKSGVKGLVDAGVTKIPRIFIHPQCSLERNPNSSKRQFSFPVIDLQDIHTNPGRRKEIVDKVRDASETLGFFNVINHGIPENKSLEMIEGVRRFFEQATAAKKQWYTRDITKTVVHNSNFDLLTSPAANWRDSFYAIMAPDVPSPDELPQACRHHQSAQDIHYQKGILENRSSNFGYKGSAELTFPIIDLDGTHTNPTKRREIVDKVRDASETWGFFQVVNHGIPNSVLEEMIQGTRRFFEEDDEVKMQLYTRDLTKKVIYNSNFDLYSSPAANWRDSMLCVMAPNTPSPDELPQACREILMEYSKEVMNLGCLLFELLSEGLGLHPSYLKDIDCTEGLSVIFNYYPECPQPELTIGTTNHSDNDFITVLLQDQLGGLQVMHQNQWIDVPPTPGALVINIGDLLQLISNDKYKSVEHRVLANRVGPRISVASFFFTGPLPTGKIYGPIKDILTDKNPPRYRETTVKEYHDHFCGKGLDGTSSLSHFKL
ncbi:OLC1v1019759C1 [Oldenlandia corymbosa var. corymbosa]|uniref:OLC1v1019759C1 n=1 Tax=Oldenlandia corymbosa var. corymbosa TaxID=529605 RepID=A0AAV1EEX6_OLDCO|nr:OLC1v1019759C1 [Oldenlandia corymbosa var. corymbosa]